ncbi:MAG TPA: MmgE/PrpD family protein [Dehalococcoidia bacterium]|nr:MmgE/PrpD family protein [Dehalococcoidia bacterium]
MKGITERLAEFASSLEFEDLPSDVVLGAKRALLDTIGVMLAGVHEEGSDIVFEYARSLAASPEATVVGSGLRTSAAYAALSNGAFGHALDFDDVNGSMRGHPSVPLAPAVLAIAEKLGLSGQAVLTAFAGGFEVECKLGRALGPSSYRRGWHATSVLGSLGAAAACANLLGLGSERTRHALGIAASMASGSRQNFGTMTKPLHAGLAARAGVESALLAAGGFTADPEIVEAPLGFGALFSPADDFRPEGLGDFGEPWDIVTPGISVKKYPCCYMTHRALDATLKASGARPVAGDEVSQIIVRVPEGSTSALIHHRPQTGLEGKFSLEYCVAAAVLDGAVRFRSFEDEAVRRPEAQELLRRVEVVYAPREERGPQPAAVTVRLRDGSELSGEVFVEHGSAADPLSWEELEAKYRDCASRILRQEQVQASYEMISRLESLRRVEDLMMALAVSD